MSELARLAPTIVGVALLAIAIGTAVWFDRTSPKVERVRPKEGAQSPFDEAIPPSADVVVSAPLPTSLVYEMMVGFGPLTKTGKVNRILSNRPITTPFARRKERARERA